jgi:hypothetical protein
MYTAPRFLSSLLVASTLLATAEARANVTTRLPNFTTLMQALKAGKNVRGIYTYSKCFIRSEDPAVPAEPGPNAIGGNTFATWEFFEKGMMGNANGFVSTSETVLITHRRYGYIYNYGRTKILDNGDVELLIEYLDPKTFEVKMHEVIDCKMTTGHGAEFFAN